DSFAKAGTDIQFTRTYLTIPKLYQKVSKAYFPWHFQIMVETKLEKDYLHEFSGELALQSEIENKMHRLISHYADVRRIGSYYAQGVTIHDWYLNAQLGEFSAADILEIDEINSKRGICFEIEYDPYWFKIKRYYADFSKKYFG
ncbi:MAG: hypothetical protein AAGA86_16080, partial [Bacteroidota bacterium]